MTSDPRNRIPMPVSLALAGGLSLIGVWGMGITPPDQSVLCAVVFFLYVALVTAALWLGKTAILTRIATVTAALAANALSILAQHLDGRGGLGAES